jgi:hypothetical protein
MPRLSAEELHEVRLAQKRKKEATIAKRLQYGFAP